MTKVLNLRAEPKHIPGILLYCTKLYCTKLHYTKLYCTKLHYTKLHCTKLYCTPTLRMPEYDKSYQVRMHVFTSHVHYYRTRKESLRVSWKQLGSLVRVSWKQLGIDSHVTLLGHHLLYRKPRQITWSHGNN
jgi:hypothetical protein